MMGRGVIVYLCSVKLFTDGDTWFLKFISRLQLSMNWLSSDRLSDWLHRSNDEVDYYILGLGVILFLHTNFSILSGNKFLDPTHMARTTAIFEFFCSLCCEPSAHLNLFIESSEKTVRKIERPVSDSDTCICNQIAHSVCLTKMRVCLPAKLLIKLKKKGSRECKRLAVRYLHCITPSDFFYGERIPLFEFIACLSFYFIL